MSGNLGYEIIKYADILDFESFNFYFIGTQKYSKNFPESIKQKCSGFFVCDELNIELFDLFFFEIGKIDHLICFSEEDLFLAASLRQKYDISGAKISDIIPFRDKYIMKKSLENNKNIKLPKFSKLSDYYNNGSIRFEHIKANFGLPFIIKPRLGMSCFGVKSINSEIDLENYLKLIEFPLNLLQVEEYINGRMFHIDSFCINKKVKCSYITEYNSPPINCDNNYIYGVLNTDFDSELYKKISQFNLDVINTLSLPNGCSHLEVFVTDRNEIFFCEIGARIGGSSIIPMIEIGYRNNLAQIWFLNELGIKSKISFEISAYPAWFNYNLLPNYKVTKINIPKKNWIFHNEVIELSNYYNKSSNDYKRVTSFVIKANSKDMLNKRINFIKKNNLIIYEKL